MWREFFPYEARLNQDKIADFCLENMKKRGIAVVEAPYGIGKTITMLSAALATGKKVIFATCNHAVQNSIVEEVLNLNKHKKNLKVASLIGKAHFCCYLENFYYEACDVARKEGSCNYYANCYNQDKDGKKPTQRMKKAIDKINLAVVSFPESLKGRNFADHIKEASMSEGVCPYEAAVCLAEQADVIVLDYYYLFSNILSFTKSRILKDPGEYVLLVDEADEIKDRLLSGLLTKSLSSYSLHNLREQVKKLVKTGKVTKEEYDALNSFSFVFNEFFNGKRGHFEVGKEEFIKFFEKNYFLFDELMEIMEELVEKVIEEDDRGTRLDHFLESWKKFDDNYFSYGLKEGMSEKLCISPYELKNVDLFTEMGVGYKFREVLDMFHSVVLFSATIGDFEIFKENLGIEAAYFSSNQFTTSNLKVILKRNMSSIFNRRQEMQEKIREDVDILKKHCPGILVSFPSMAASYGVVDKIDAKTVEEINPLTGGVYYVVLGGKNSRGVNKAAHLNAVYIYGLQIPMPDDFLFNKRKDYHFKKYGEEKAYRMLYSNVVNKAGQTAGRIFRSKNKKGVVILADNRYKFDYRLKDFFYTCIPAYFKEKLVETTNQQEFEAELDEFWAKP